MSPVRPRLLGLLALLLGGCAHPMAPSRSCADEWPPHEDEAAFEPRALAPGTGRLDGVIHDDEETGLARLVVELREVDGEGRIRAVTDASGVYTFENLPARELELDVLVDGRVQASKSVAMAEGVRARVNVRLDGLGGGREIVEASSLPAGALLRVDRSACLGSCPSFSIVVFEDGRWTWDGGTHTRARGRQSGQLSPAQLERLRRVERCLSEVPTYDWFELLDVSRLALTLRDEDRVVRLYARTRDQTPPAVLAAVDELARVLPIKRLVGRKWRW